MRETTERSIRHPLFKPKHIANLLNVYNHGDLRTVKRKGIGVKTGEAYQLSLFDGRFYITNPAQTNIHISTTSERRAYNMAGQLGIRWIN